MKTNKPTMAICLWYNGEAEPAVKHYTTIFKNSWIDQISRSGESELEHRDTALDKVLAISFRLNELHFLALNGGPYFKFNEATSVMVYCKSQEEIDYYWESLSEGGEEGRCGWLKDKYGVSWQIVPEILPDLMNTVNQKKSQKVMDAFMQMNKFDIATIKKAYENG